MSGLGWFIAGWASCGALMVFVLSLTVAASDRRDRPTEPEPKPEPPAVDPEPLYVPREWVA